MSAGFSEQRQQCIRPGPGVTVDQPDELDLVIQSVENLADIVDVGLSRGRPGIASCTEVRASDESGSDGDRSANLKDLSGYVDLPGDGGHGLVEAASW